MCVDGDVNGPYNATCDVFQFGSCGDTDCDANRYCYSCIEDSNCGWCESTRLCYESSSYDTGSCTKENYFHGGSSNDECVYDEEAEKEKEKYEIEIRIARLRDEEKELEELIDIVEDELEELDN
jgi:hypothetical protein